MGRKTILVGIVAAATACGAPPEEQSSESSEKLAGFAVPDGGDAAVVGMYWQSKDGGTFLCTGEVVAPRVVLTAGHCVVEATKAFVFVGLTYDLRREQVDVAKLVPHPQYDPTTGLNDIAALVLAAPLNVTPLTINRTPVDQLAGLDRVKLVGYGVTDANDPTTAGTKRMGYGQVTQIAGSEILVQGNTQLLQAVGCRGDSGGATIVGGVLIGTESRGDQDCKIGTIKERVDYYAPFIDSVIAAAK